jgi:hypothetical protein
MRRGIALCQEALAFGDISEPRPFCAVENRAAPKRRHCDYHDNYKWQVAFHARDERRIFDAPTESSRAGWWELAEHRSEGILATGTPFAEGDAG